ncbi:hypothetical protein JNUCC64_20060 [Streptomyces sp. JNUCC 64]
MGSLRNPVGPLPSTIYWRRRAILLSLAAVLTLLVVWMVSSRGGGGDGDAAGGSSDKNPVESITPGPSGSGPAISEKPGGRDEAGSGGAASGGSGGSGTTGGDGDGSGGTGGGDGGDGDGSSGADSGSGGGDGDGDAASGGGAAAGGSGGSGSGSGERVPAGSSLPDCTSSSVRLKLGSAENAYGPGKDPELRLTAENTSDITCKLDLGPAKAVVTITQADDDEDVWSSAHCPDGSGSLLLKVPAKSSVTRTLEWDRERSAPECATPSGGKAAPDTYLVAAEARGFTVAPTSFVLRRD